MSELPEEILVVLNDNGTLSSPCYVSFSEFTTLTTDKHYRIDKAGIDEKKNRAYIILEGKVETLLTKDMPVFFFSKDDNEELLSIVINAQEHKNSRFP
jgi:hypothetical protein